MRWSHMCLTVGVLVPAIGVPGGDSRSTYSNPVDGSTMILVPSGAAVVGSDRGEANEKPQRAVTVPAFYLSKHEITNRQWATFIEANPEWRRDRIKQEHHNSAYLKHWGGGSCPLDKAAHPVVFVSWFAGGEVFRSGCCFYRGRGKIFYFRPGHETFPIYHNEQVLRVIANAARWAAPVQGPPDLHLGENVEPLEKLS